MGRLSAQNQMIIAIAIIVVLAAVAVFLGIMPLFSEASEIDVQIATEQSNLSTAQALVARRQSAKAQSAANEVELMRIANSVPDSPQLPSVIIELQDVANASGLEFPQINVGAVNQGPAAPDGTPAGYHVLPITISLRGDWSDLIEYQHRITKLERGVRVTSSTFAYVPGTETTPAMVQGTIVLEVYMMVPAAGTTPTAPADATSD
ncbi:MAG: type 4a pilus biogenesis protein PilO [Coriobacteriia bacterium]|nr:type 4a pilus biogenesis protein PilO [Coriobacteriia bacterium]